MTTTWLASHFCLCMSSQFIQCPIICAEKSILSPIYPIFLCLFPFFFKYSHKQIKKINYNLDYSYPESEFKVICINFYTPHPSHPLPKSHSSSSSHFSAESYSISSHTPHSPFPASFSSRWSIVPSPSPTKPPRPGFASASPAGFADSATVWSAHSSISALRPSSHRFASSQLRVVRAVSLPSVLDVLIPLQLRFPRPYDLLRAFPHADRTLSPILLHRPLLHFLLL